MLILFKNIFLLVTFWKLYFLPRPKITYGLPDWNLFTFSDNTLFNKRQRNKRFTSFFFQVLASPYRESFDNLLKVFVNKIVHCTSFKYSKIYSSVRRKYNTGPILPSYGQIVQFFFLAIRPSHIFYIFFPLKIS